MEDKASARARTDLLNWSGGNFPIIIINIIGIIGIIGYIGIIGIIGIIATITAIIIILTDSFVGQSKNHYCLTIELCVH